MARLQELLAGKAAPRIVKGIEARAREPSKASKN